MALIARITADTSGFDAGLKRADSMVGKFTTQVGKKLALAFGTGYLTAQIKGVLSEVFSKAEEISNTSKQIGRTTDEVQLLQIAAKEAGMTLSEYLEKARSGAVDLNAVLEDMRKRRGIQLISEGDIQELVKDMNVIRGVRDAWINRAAKVVGSTARAGGALLSGDWREAGLQGLRALSAASPFALPSNWMDRDRDTKPVSGVIGPQLMFDPRFALALGLDFERKKLQGQIDAQKATSSIWNPDLTRRQEMGAFVRRPGIVITEAKETNLLLKELEKRAASIDATLSKLTGG